MAWIDGKRAFDNAPHWWILKILNILKILPFMLTFLKYNVKKNYIDDTHKDLETPIFIW